MLLSIEGMEATTKTTMALTSPTPSVMFAFDIGEERAIYGSKYEALFADKTIEIVKYDDKATPEKLKTAWENKDITIFELPRPIQLSDTLFHGVTEQWNYFISLFGYATGDKNIKSIIVDTMTKARRIKADAHLQTMQENIKGNDQPRVRLIQIEYGVPNGAIESLYSLVKGMGRQNLIATHHLADEYDEVMIKGDIKNMKTGKQILEGWNKTYPAVDVAIRMLKENNGEVKISTEVIKCGFNLTLEGNKISNPTWSKLTEQIEASLGGRISI